MEVQIMDGKTLLDSKRYAKYLAVIKQQSNNTATLISQEKAKRENSRLNKFKLEKNSSYVLLFPVVLKVPFNPVDLDNDAFCAEGFKARIPGSFDTGVALIKQMANENEALRDRLCKEYRVTAEQLHLDTAEIVDDAERAIWRRYAGIEYETEVVGKTKFSSDGQWGRTYKLTPVYNEQNELTGVSGAYQTAFEMESDLINFKLQEVKELYTTGAMATRPPKEMEAEKDKVKKMRLIGKPRYQSVTRLVVLPADDNKGNINSKTLAKIRDCKGKLDDFSFWTKINSNDINKYEAVLGSVDDTHNNFIEVIFEVGEGETSLELYQHINQSVANKVTTAFGEDESGYEKNKGLKTLEEYYRALRDNGEAWSTDILLNSVWDFHTISDEALLGKLNTDIKVYHTILEQPEIKQKWIGLLGAMSYDLSQALQSREIDEKDIISLESSTVAEGQQAADESATEESLVDSGLDIDSSESLISNSDLEASLLDIEDSDF